MEPSIPIARHKHIESVLRNVGQLAEEIIRSAPQGIIVYDTAVRYQLFNPLMQKLTGKSKADVLGKIAAESLAWSTMSRNGTCPRIISENRQHPITVSKYGRMRKTKCDASVAF